MWQQLKHPGSKQNSTRASQTLKSRCNGISSPHRLALTVSLCSISHIGIQETSNGWIGLQAIGAFHQTMTFILKAHIFHRYIALSECATICSASPTGTRGSLAP